MAIVDFTDEQKTAVTKMRERESSRLDPQPDKNIIHVGEKEPATTLRNGSTKYELPDAETQRKGFYHPSAAELVRRYPSKFKRFKRKGDK